MLISGSLPVFAEEQYYYTDDVPPLTSPPTFCAVRFSDPNIPDAHEKMYELTKKAVFDWRTKLIDHTGNVGGWDFKYKEVNSWEIEEKEASNMGCDVPIYFTTTYYFEEGERGVAEYYSDGSAIVTISYVSALIDVKKLIQDPDSVSSDPNSILIIDKNKIAPDVESVIKHEIGHVLRLDHPSLNPNEFEFSSERTEFVPPSIMFSPVNLNGEILDKLVLDITRDHPELEPMDFSSLMYSGVSERNLRDVANKIFNSPTSSVISDYDIRSVVNLYGENGISSRYNHLPTQTQDFSDFPSLSSPSYSGNEIAEENSVNVGTTTMSNSAMIPDYIVFIIPTIIFLVAIYAIIKVRRHRSNYNNYYSSSTNVKNTSSIQPEDKTDVALETYNSASSPHSKKCPYCNRRLTDFDKPRKCNNCNNLVT